MVCVPTQEHVDARRRLLRRLPTYAGVYIRPTGGLDAHDTHTSYFASAINFPPSSNSFEACTSLCQGCLRASQPRGRLTMEKNALRLP